MLSRSPTREPPRPPSYRPTLNRPNPLRHRTIPIIFGSITLFALSGYCTYLYVTLTRAPPTAVSSSPSSQADVSSRYDSIARTFDTSVDWTETVLRITKLRKKLLSKAHGDVLEVSIGTGRNLEYYNWGLTGHDGEGKLTGTGTAKEGKVRSFTAVDKSGEMLDIAREKFSKMVPGILGVRWIVGDASQEIPSAPTDAGDKDGNLEGRKYDTVVQTMGLCSADDPVALLKNLGSCVKEDGKILLLEHGRGDSEWLNGILDKFAEGHAKQFGCWWNRDLGEIVKGSGLDIVDMHTVWWHGGTTWWIELRKPKDHTTEGKAVIKEPQRDEGAKKKWW
jgi:methyltransferase OMS1, mitochondrial